ncbi:F-box protein pof6 [Spathaspora sp. JA1]|nr:F-box protein pof6 [Spathaspora sp. JA1]
MSHLLWNSDIEVYNPQAMPYSIAQCIVQYLAIPDLITFSYVSRNCQRAANDPQVWISLLRTLGIWDNATVITKESIQKNPNTMKYLDNPLTCVEYVYKSRRNAKYQMLKIYRCLYPYYIDLKQKSFNDLKMLKRYNTPMDQFRILRGLQMYNKIDYSGDRRLVSAKINELFELFENALLREVDLCFDFEEYDQMKQFVLVLIELNNSQGLIDFYLQKMDSIDLPNIEYFQKDESEEEEGEEAFYNINEEAIENLLLKFADILNHQNVIIKKIFPPDIPLMYKVCEELISNQLHQLVVIQIKQAKKYQLYNKFIPFIYSKLTIDLVKKIKNTEYHLPIIGLIDMNFEPIIAEYIREEVQYTKSHSNELISVWKRDNQVDEEKDNKEEEKGSDFLTSFKNVFAISSKSESSDSDKPKRRTFDSSVFDPDFIQSILDDVSISIQRLLLFKTYSIISLRNDIFSSIHEIFINVIDTIYIQHLKPGFQKVLQYLAAQSEDNQPLLIFFDVINMADVILNMIDVFYKSEITFDEQNAINASLTNKKRVEKLIDNYVADGLNISIELLTKQIQNIYDEKLTNQYLVEAIGETTLAANEAISLLEQNMNLLIDNNIEKSIIEVFQQEIAERFFQIIVKTIKSQTISVKGAPNLISDVNLYYEFMYTQIKTNKRLILPLYQSLQKVSNIYLISGEDSKSIGKLIVDLSKFNGIFKQEEIYEFVQRRQDWNDIKKEVEKVMYGFDCRVI